MSDATCPICGAEPRPRAIYCSERCKWTASNRKRSRKDTGRVCAGCLTPIGQMAASAKFCSNGCRRWVANGNTTPRIFAVECLRCGASMGGKRAGAIYCTKRCKLAASEGRRAVDNAARYRKERGRRLAYAIAYAKANPQVGQRAKRRRKAQLAGAGVFRVSELDWRRLCLRYDNRCAYCCRAARLTMDHIVPVSRGGRHSIGNLIPACASCNASKNDRTILEWRLGRQLGRLKGGGSHPLEAQRTRRSSYSRPRMPGLADGELGAA